MSLTGARTMTRGRTVATAVTLAAAACLGIAVAGAGLLAASHAVAMSGDAFAPGSITVAVGDTVTWTNSDARAHTATADDGSFDTGPLGNGASGSVTFEAAGTIAYHCEVHPFMTGTVVVEAATGPDATTPPTDALADANPPADTTAWPLVVAIASLAFAWSVLRLRRVR